MYVDATLSVSEHYNMKNKFEHTAYGAQTSPLRSSISLEDHHADSAVLIEFDYFLSPHRRNTVCTVRLQVRNDGVERFYPSNK